MRGIIIWRPSVWKYLLVTGQDFLTEGIMLSTQGQAGLSVFLKDIWKDSDW